MNILDIYCAQIPDFISEIAETEPMQRLLSVGMNCGCEYSSTSVFREIGGYTRYEHSLGAGLIVWRFTGDIRQAVAALLHDIASPCFAHVIDFLHGDYETQESTEDRTLSIIRSSEDLVNVLSKYHLTPEDVFDYHLFPIADNDTPRLSSDRLEYTLGNGINYRFISKDDAKVLFDNIEAGTDEEGSPELIFKDKEPACRFARLSLDCSKIYSGDEDRCLMQRLAEIIRDCISKGFFSEDDLYKTEPFIIGKILNDDGARTEWERFRSISGVHTSAEAEGPYARVINAKKRHINPLVKGLGRVTDLDLEYKRDLAAYLATPYDYPVSPIIC